MHGGDDDLGIVVEEGNELVALDTLRQLGVALHVREPDDGVDALGRAARHLPLQHPPAGIAPEIGFDKRFGDAGKRRRFYCQPQHRNEPAQRREVGIGEAVRARRGPARHETVHLADGRLLVELLQQREIIGLTGLPEFFEDRKVADLTEFKPKAQFVLVAIEKLVERALRPAFQRQPVVLDQRTVLRHDRLERLVVGPREGAARIDGMQRVDDRGRPRQGQPGVDAARAEALQQHQLAVADETPADGPVCNARNVALVHRLPRCPKTWKM